MNAPLADAAADDFRDFTRNDWSYFGGAMRFPCGAAPFISTSDAGFAIIVSGEGFIEIAMGAPPLNDEECDPPYFQIVAPRNRRVALAMARAIRDELRRIADPTNQIAALIEMGFIDQNARG